MNQPVPNELISAYFDGEVTPEERRQVEHLLESSTDLRQLLDDTSKLSALLHSFPRETPPAELVANVQKRVDAVTLATPPSPLLKRRSLRREWTAFGAGIMATMASLICFYVAFNQSKTTGDYGEMAHSKTSSEGLLRDSVAANNLKPMAHNTKDSAARRSENALKDSEMDRAQAADGRASASGVSDFTLRESDGQIRADTTNSLAERTIVEAPELAEFLDRLKRGDVIRREIVDPNDAVAVVEFTVVDIYRGAEEMQLLFQKRKLQQFEDPDAFAANGKDNKEVSQRNFKANNKAASPDDMVVIFVRGPGTELADTMKSSLDNHPDIYKKLTPQLPIQLSANLAGDSINGLAGNAISDVSSSPTMDRDENGDVDQQTVAVEANLAVNLLANRDGMTLDESPMVERQNMKLAAAADAPAKTEKSGEDASRSKADGAANSMAKRGVPERAKAADKKSPEQAGANSSGYATFQLAQNRQLQNGQQQLPMRKNSVQMNQAGPIAIQSNPLHAQQNPFGNNNPNSAYSQKQGQVNSLRRSNRLNADNHDPHLVRMLIVLKTEQPASPPAP